MELDVLSFVLGSIVTVTVSLLYVGVARTVERRMQWNEVMFESLETRNPSEEYWGKRLTDLDSTPPTTFDEKESEIVRIISPRRSSS